VSLTFLNELSQGHVVVHLLIAFSKPLMKRWMVRTSFKATPVTQTCCASYQLCRCRFSQVILDCADYNVDFYEKSGFIRKEIQMVKYF
jgi:hypothetical protein